MSRTAGYIAGENRTTGETVRELIRARRVLWILIRRDLQVRYAESALGYLWSVLEPLLMGGIYWFVFTLIFERKIGGEPYIVFLLAGMLPWMWFASGMQEGAKALHSQRRLIASTALPRQIWVFRSVCAKGAEFIFSIPVFIIFTIFFPPEFNNKIPLVLLGIVIQLILLLGLGFILSPMMMLYRDLEPLIRVATRMLFYASPVLYGLNDVLSLDLPEAFKFVYYINPVAGIVECYRSGFFPGETRYDVIAMAAVISILLFVVGWYWFRKMESRILKEI